MPLYARFHVEGHLPHTPGKTAAGPLRPDGGDFGLLSAGYTPTGDNGGITNNQPYIKNSLIVDLGAYNGSLSSVSNLRFQYGTALTDTHFGSGVPEPGTWAMMLLGFGGIGVSMRRRRRHCLAQLA